MPKSNRRQGLFPWLWERIVSGVTWIAQHPQPIIISFVIAGVLWGFWTQARYAEAFNVAHVELPTDIDFAINDPVVGRNIWEVDIQELAKQLEQQQPWLKDVRVVRALPDKIRIEAIHRIPVAQVRLDEWYPVDSRGYILPQPVNTDQAALVQLEGFARTSTRLKAGRMNEHPELLRALRIVGVLRQSPILQDYRLSHLNIADTDKIRIYLDGEIEVLCGSEAELPTNLQRLRIALEQLQRTGTTDIRQIDVRFPQPVVTTNS